MVINIDQEPLFSAEHMCYDCGNKGWKGAWNHGTARMHEFI